MRERYATLSRFLYEELLKRICNEEFAEGSRLPSEEVLAKEYKISRPVVREALALLREDGFIQSRRGAGSFLVRRPAPSLLGATPLKDLPDVQRCFEFRYFLEGEIAYQAAKRHDALDKKEMQKAYDAQFSKVELARSSDLELDMAFHLSLAKATHNRFFHEALHTIKMQMLNGMQLISDQYGVNVVEHRRIKETEHNAVLRAVLAGDQEAARTTMQLHILNARDWIYPE